MDIDSIVKTTIGFVDVTTGLEWLSLRKTSGLSPIDADRAHENFRLASTDELTNLFNMLPQTPGSPGDLITYCRCSLLVNLFGETFNIAGKGPGLNGFIFQNPSDIESPTVNEISIDLNTQTGFFGNADVQFPLSGGAHRNNIATFLVR